MTITELIKDLTEYAEDSEKGFDTEVRSYVGMSRQAAEQRLQECEDDEYIFDDFLPISYVHEINGFVYIRATDIPEVEPQESEDYEAKEKERKDNPDKYPYFAYYQFGFHRMTYITEEELKEAIKFYHLKSDCKGGYFRYGRQPITILPRNDKAESEDKE